MNAKEWLTDSGLVYLNDAAAELVDKYADEKCVGKYDKGYKDGQQSTHQPLPPGSSFADYCANPYHLPDAAWKDICAQADVFAARVQPQPSTEPQPFDLQRALAGEPVVARCGRKILELQYFKTTKQVLALLEEAIGFFYYDDNGKSNPEEDSDDDLFMAPRFVIKWVNLFVNHSAEWYDSEEEALFSRNTKLAGYTQTAPIRIPVK